MFVKDLLPSLDLTNEKIPLSMRDAWTYGLYGTAGHTGVHFSWPFPTLPERRTSSSRFGGMAHLKESMLKLISRSRYGEGILEPTKKLTGRIP